MASTASAATLKPISADSHVVEPPDCYIKRIDRKYRDVAPHVVREGNRDFFVVAGQHSHKVPMGSACSAGRDPIDIGVKYATYEEMWSGGWDPKQRVLDQDRDGVAAELVYPTVGMTLAWNPDIDYRHACIWAYNRWLEEYVAGAPGRLFGIGQTTVRSVEDGIADLRRIKAMGFKGALLPSRPGTPEDWDSPIFDPFWETAVELNLPLSFHILTDKKDMETRGPEITWFMGVVRNIQDIIAMLIFTGCFDRHPKLKMVCVEGDAGWVPHFMYRMDHIYKRQRYRRKCMELKRLPGEQFAEQIYLTFQDDWIAFRVTNMLNPNRLMWANDFPHSDSTWPWSQEMLAEHTKDLPIEHKSKILRDNVSALYDLKVQ